MGKLTEDQKQLDVISIVGMGGVGKTTLATKIFNDPFVVYHFDVRAWVTVSQTYRKHDLLIQILASIGIEFDPVSASHSELHEKLRKSLLGKRYFIVIDDIWSVEAWDHLKLFFPNGNYGSRILITSRIKKVALHAKPHGLIHQLKCLTNEESWELLCKKVFHGSDCPQSLIKPGTKIAEDCHGLPLTVVFIAEILAKVEAHKESWERISQNMSSYVLSDKNGMVDILGLSYDHLPPHLKDCFLYLNCFPKYDHKFRVRKLIWLWIAEGFIQEDGNRSLEEIGEDYMMELVDRNLVLVVKRKSNGAIKDCSVHQHLRDLCLEKAKEGNFWRTTNPQMTSLTSATRYKPFCIFRYSDSIFKNSPYQSLFCFHLLLETYPTYGHFSRYSLLRVLDLQKCRLEVFPWDLKLLVHLRYLAFWYVGGFPSSICNLQSLQTVIARSSRRLYLPKAISNLVNLRHLWSEGGFKLPMIEKQMNLLTISNVALDDDAECWEKCFPVIKKLTCMTSTHKNQGFNSLTTLETLMLIHTASGGSQAGDQVITRNGKFQKIHVTFPASLKNLSLRGCRLLWSDMSVIQSLPNLEVLKLLESAFHGPKWETGEAQFQQLKYLKLEGLDIRQWEASSINFPCLKHIVLDKCKDLEEIPLEFGHISTLERIDIDDSSSSAVNSLDKLHKKQQNDLMINVRRESHRLKHIVLDQCEDLEKIPLTIMDIRMLEFNISERKRMRYISSPDTPGYPMFGEWDFS